MFVSHEAEAVASELDVRLHTSPWDPQPAVTPATGVADFALALSGKRREARKSGRWGKLIRHFALAACLALASVAAACDRPNAGATESAESIDQLPTSSATNATIIRGSPTGSRANFSDLVLVNPGSDAEPWAVMVPKTAAAGTTPAPVLVDRAGSDLNNVGSVYSLPAQPVLVGTRDGPSQFLDPLVAADETGKADSGQQTQTVQSWQQDERYLAATRAIKGQPTVLDAAYNAEAAANAGGTHTYQNGVVLRVEPDQPVLQVIDKALLESGKPTRAEDVVYVAIRPNEKSLYEPGTVVNLRDVVMDRQQTDVNGQATTLYVANAALDGARVESTGKVDLQSLLQPRLQRVDQDLAAQAQDPGTQTGANPAATATPGTATQPQTVIVNQGHNSFVPDFLVWMWIANSGFYRGPSVIINNPPSSPNRSGDVFYSPPPNSSSTAPSTVSSSQADARATALQASRSAVSGQSGGTGGGVAATNKAASEASSRVSAATAKAATVAGAVGAASAGKSISSVPKSTSSSSSVSSRSAGSVSAGSRGTSITSSGSSGGGFGGKGIGSSSSS